MVALTVVKDTLGIVNSAAELLKNTGAVKTGAKAIIAARDASRIGGSLTQYSSQTQIISRVFIDESIADEIVLPNFLKCSHEWYAAQIITALHLQRLVTDKIKVQDVLSVVQDGRYNRAKDMTDNLLRSVAGTESFLGNYLGEAALEAMRYDHFNQPIGDDGEGPNYKAPKYKNGQKYDNLNQPIREDGKKANYSGVSIRPVKPSEHRIGPMGELFEVTITNPHDKSLSVRVPIFVQMQPSIVPAMVAPRFIDRNVDLPLWNRWTQMRAGELSFWKDFVLKKDYLDRKIALTKDPEAAAAMRDFLSTVSKKDMYAMGDIGAKANERSANLANSVMVFSEETVAAAASQGGIDLHDDATRKRYFNDTYTMMIAVIDAMHQRVTVYFNGIDGSLDVSYNEFKPTNSKFEPNDFMAALQAFSTNSVGRLR